MVNISFFATVLQIEFTAAGIQVTGFEYSLTCSVRELHSLPGEPAVQWLGPAGLQLPAGDPDIVIQESTEQGPLVVVTLTFTTLRARHAGVYTCLAQADTNDEISVEESRSTRVDSSEQ